jgi:hypothetical protein
MAWVENPPPQKTPKKATTKQIEEKKGWTLRKARPQTAAPAQVLVL